MGGNTGTWAVPFAPPGPSALRIPKPRGPGASGRRKVLPLEAKQIDALFQEAQGEFWHSSWKLMIKEKKKTNKKRFLCLMPSPQASHL